MVHGTLVLGDDLKQDGVQGDTQALEQSGLQVGVDENDEVQVREVEVGVRNTHVLQEETIGVATLEHDAEVGHEVPVDKGTSADLGDEHLVELEGDLAVGGVLGVDGAGEGLDHGRAPGVLRLSTGVLGVHPVLVRGLVSRHLRRCAGSIDEGIAGSGGPGNHCCWLKCKRLEALSSRGLIVF